jgi:hypothetical protein
MQSSYNNSRNIVITIGNSYNNYRNIVTMHMSTTSIICVISGSVSIE